MLIEAKQLTRLAPEIIAIYSVACNFFARYQAESGMFKIVGLAQHDKVFAGGVATKSKNRGKLLRLQQAMRLGQCELGNLC